MTELEYNRILWLYQEAYQQLTIKYVNLYSSGIIPKKLKEDLFDCQVILEILNRYIESEIVLDAAVVNNFDSDEIVRFFKVLRCYFNKYGIRYLLKDPRTDLSNVIPNNLILQENGEPILQENLEYILL